MPKPSEAKHTRSTDSTVASAAAAVLVGGAGVVLLSAGCTNVASFSSCGRVRCREQFGRIENELLRVR